MRAHLRTKVEDTASLLEDAGTKASREKLLGLLVDAELESRKKSGVKVEDESAVVKAAPIAPAVSMAVQAIFGFLAEASKTHPELCVTPLRLLGTVIAAFKPQELASEGMSLLADARLCAHVMYMRSRGRQARVWRSARLRQDYTSCRFSWCR